MKFLILALSVCAASAAQIGVRNSWQRQQQQQFYQPTAQAVASASVTPSSVTVTPFARNYQSVTPSVAKAYSSVSSPVAPVAKAYSSVVQPAVEKVAEPVVQTYNAVQAAPVAAKSVVHTTGDAEAPIVRSVVDVAADGFNYAFEAGNGISAQEHGFLKRVNDVDAINVEGSYQYQGPEGPVFVSYIADENGFQPKSDIIPTSPPVPVAILRALEWIASQPKQVETAYKKQ